MSKSKPPAEQPKTLEYWPYCGVCRRSFEFDKNEPFAYCDCGTTEWGYPRPAEYVQEPVQLRPEVLAFAKLMEARLREKDADRGVQGWKEMSPIQLYNQLAWYFSGLHSQIEQKPVGARSAKKAADVANYAMMIADVVGGLK